MAVKHGPTHADAIASGQTLVLSDSCSCWCWSRRAAWADSSARVITKVPGRPGFQDRLMIRLLKTRLLFGCHAGRPIFTYRHGIRRACSRFAARAQGSRAREAGPNGLFSCPLRRSLLTVCFPQGGASPGASPGAG